MPSTAADLVSIALSQEGLKEDPPGENKGPEIDKYADGIPGYTQGMSWCVAFVYWCLKNINLQNIDVPQTLSVEVFYDYYLKKYPATIVDVSHTPLHVGDLVARVNMPGSHNHLGIVTDIRDDGVWYISGNTTNPKDNSPKKPGVDNDWFVCNKKLTKYNAAIRLF